MIEEDTLSSFEARIASLKPTKPAIDRDRLMFLAGQASVAYWPTHRHSTLRPVLISSFVAVFATLLVMTITQSTPNLAKCFSLITSSEDSPPAVAATRPVSDDVQYRVEVGNSLGWMVSLLVGRRSDEEKAHPESNLVRMRREMLREDQSFGRKPLEPTSEAKEDMPHKTEDCSS